MKPATNSLEGRVVCLLGGEESGLREALLKVLGAAGATVVPESPVAPDQHVAAVEGTVERHGRIDALVTCPVPAGDPAPLLEMDPADFDAAVEAQLGSVFGASQAAARAMIEAHAGTIVHVTSVDGLEGRAGRGLRAACHHGIVGLCQSLADELRHHGIKVVPLMPDESGGLDPTAVAELVGFLLAQPSDTVLLGGVVAPVGARRRRP